ncbi:MAG: hypothetical protein ACLQF0_05600 [Dissulfurispiraceae bacterium]
MIILRLYWKHESVATAPLIRMINTVAVSVDLHFAAFQDAHRQVHRDKEVVVQENRVGIPFTRGVIALLEINIVIIIPKPVRIPVIMAIALIVSDGYDGFTKLPQRKLIGDFARPPDFL